MESKDIPEVEETEDTPEVEDTPEIAKKPAGKKLSSKQVAANKAAIKASEQATADKAKADKKAGIVAHIELLKGVQVNDHQAGILYRRGYLTPVTEISSFAKRQEGHRLLKIHRIKE